MTLTQYKKIFSEHFGIPATAANARLMLKTHGKRIKIKEFKTALSWSKVIYTFHLEPKSRQVDQQTVDKISEGLSTMPDLRDVAPYFPELVVKRLLK